MIPPNLGAWLREARRERLWSQAELARALGVHHAVVSRWESGQRVPSLAHVYAIARVLNTPLERLLPPISLNEQGDQS